MDSKATDDPPAAHQPRRRPSQQGCELDSIQIDWLLVRHDDDSEAIQSATAKAFQYLRALRKSIPIPEVTVCSAWDARGDGGARSDDEDVPLGGCSVEAAQRERYAAKERANLNLLDSSDEEELPADGPDDEAVDEAEDEADEEPTIDPKHPRRRSSGEGATAGMGRSGRAVGEGGGAQRKRRPAGAPGARRRVGNGPAAPDEGGGSSSRRSFSLRLKLIAPDGTDASASLRMHVPWDAPQQFGCGASAAAQVCGPPPARGDWKRREEAMLQEALERSRLEYLAVEEGDAAAAQTASSSSSSSSGGSSSGNEGGKGGGGKVGGGKGVRVPSKGGGGKGGAEAEEVSTFSTPRTREHALSSAHARARARRTRTCRMRTHTRTRGRTLPDLGGVHLAAQENRTRRRQACRRRPWSRSRS